MRKKIYRGVPGYVVVCCSNRTPDLFDEKRWKPKAGVKTIHELLKKYIKKWVSPEGKILRTKGKSDSTRLAIKIFKRFMELVQEDMIENLNFFALPSRDVLGIRQTYRYNPDAMNRFYETYYQQTPWNAKRTNTDYVFIFDRAGYKKLRAKLHIHGNGNSNSKDHYLNAVKYTQEYYNKRDRYRKLVWGMH